MWVDIEVAEYIRDHLGFPDARLAFRLDRELRHPNGQRVLGETRYFISNLDPDEVSPEELMGNGRGHWGVENSLHFIKDRWWDEDRHYMKRPGLAVVLAGMVTWSLALLRSSDRFPADVPMRGRADRLCWDPQEALTVIGLSPAVAAAVDTLGAGADPGPPCNKHRLDPPL